MDTTTEESLSKIQAIELMLWGYKLTHRVFPPGEFVYSKYGVIRDEVNSVMRNFCEDRKGIMWETGWRIYNPLSP
jgi:hypothetical protein